MDRDDVLNTKRALNALGFLEAPDYGLTPYPDVPMIAAVKGFQRRHKLRVDGVMNPDGPTLERINHVLATRRAKLFERISEPESIKPISSSALLPEEMPTVPRSVPAALATTEPPRIGNPPPPKKPGDGVKTAAAGAAIPAVAGGIPAILGAIAGMLGLTLPLGRDTPKDNERGRRCDEQYEQDSEICRQVSAKHGPQAARRCWESANLRYGNCLAGRPVPDLDRGTD
jgi:hypothetical protein